MPADSEISLIGDVAKTAGEVWQTQQTVSEIGSDVPGSTGSDQGGGHDSSFPGGQRAPDSESAFSSLSDPRHTARGDEVLDSEYIGYCEIKIVLAYKKMSGSDDPAELESCVNDLVFLIKSLASHPSFRPKDSTAFAVLLTLGDKRIDKVVKDELRKPSVAEHRVTTKSTLEWLDGQQAICRFKHPHRDYGMVERAFLRSELPKGIAKGDQFDLEIELDSTGRPKAYLPRMDSLEKAAPDPSDAKRPVLPRNRNDKKAMSKYDRLLNKYLKEAFTRDAGNY
jgi:hypothetical protein